MQLIEHTQCKMKGQKIFLIILFSLTGLYYGCDSECQTECPVPCTSIGFQIFYQGSNILLQDPPLFPLEDIRVESTPANPVAPPLFEINDDRFSMVVCRDASYQLFLNDNLVLNVEAGIDTASQDECCTFFKARYIRFNGTDLCPDSDACSGGIFTIP